MQKHVEAHIWRSGYQITSPCYGQSSGEAKSEIKQAKEIIEDYEVDGGDRLIIHHRRLGE